MSEPGLFQIFLSRLNAMGIPYMVTGAVASIVYGEPRLTHDMDVVIDLESNRVDDFAKTFPPDSFYCPPVEVIREELKRRMRGHFNLVHHETGFKADIYLIGLDPLHLWAFPRRRRMDLEGEPLWVASPEYVILRKLEYFKEGGSQKHLKDILGMLEISSGEIDTHEIAEKARETGVLIEWESVLSDRQAER